MPCMLRLQGLPFRPGLTNMLKKSPSSLRRLGSQPAIKPSSLDGTSNIGTKGNRKDEEEKRNGRIDNRYQYVASAPIQYHVR
jgi:hypothetical protein